MTTSNETHSRASGRYCGVDWETQQSQMYAEWRKFDQRLDAESRLSAAAKSGHRRRFERKMRELYGASYPDAKWTAEHEQRGRANREGRGQRGDR